MFKKGGGKKVTRTGLFLGQKIYYGSHENSAFGERSTLRTQKTDCL